MSSENGTIPLDYDSENSMDCLTLEWQYLFFEIIALVNSKPGTFVKFFLCSFGPGKSCVTKFHNTCMYTHTQSLMV